MNLRYAKRSEDTEQINVASWAAWNEEKNKTLEQIADELEESVEDIQLIYDIVNKHAPEYDVDAITAEVLEVQEKYE